MANACNSQISILLLLLNIFGFDPEKCSTWADLTVRVQYGGQKAPETNTLESILPQGDVYEEVISGNSSTDTVTIEFKLPDGTIVTQLTDFRMQSQLVRVFLLGEEDLGEPRSQAFCFVSAFTGDMIPPEAVMKLRQKNPWTIRVADEDRGQVDQESPLVLDSSAIRQSIVSSHLHSFCKDAKSTIFSSEHELFNILDSVNGPDFSSISKSAVEDHVSLSRCHALPQTSKGPCLCNLKICFDWYPCTLKYCKNSEGEGEHRCGIKTCRKCTNYFFPAKSKKSCLWDTK